MKPYSQSFNETPKLKDFAERNKKWMQEREMKLQKSKEKMQGVMTECTFKPNLAAKKRPLTKDRRPLTSIPSPKKPTITKV